MKSQMNLQFNLDNEYDDTHGIQDEDAIRLEARIEEFKEDPEKMQELNEFVDEVLQKAQTEVDRKSATKVRSDKDKFREGLALLNNIKRGRIVTRARGFAIRMFEAICNCTNSSPVPPPGAAAATAVGATAQQTRPATS